MRAGFTMLVVLLLTACAGAPSISPSPQATPSPVPTGTPAPTPEAVRILATDLWADFESPLAVAAATDPEEWDALWSQVGLQIPQPEVNFEQDIVLYLGMAGSSSCPERFERLVVDDTQRVYAEWTPPPVNQPCTDDMAAQGLLVAVLRSVLPSEPFQFTLRAQPVCPDCPTHPDQMVVDPT